MSRGDRGAGFTAGQYDGVEGRYDGAVSVLRQWGMVCGPEIPIPAGIKAGVLSEDAVYDEITAAREADIRVLELATDILKNRL